MESANYIENFIKSLDGIKRDIFNARIINSKTLKETGETISLSKERVRQIEGRIMMKFSSEEFSELLINDMESKNTFFISKDLFDNELYFTIIQNLTKFGFIKSTTVQDDVIYFINKEEILNIENFISKHETTTNSPIISITQLISELNLDVNKIKSMLKIGKLSMVKNTNICIKPTSKRRALEIVVANMGIEGFPLLKRSNTIKKLLNEEFPEVFEKSQTINIVGYLNNNKNLILKEWGVYVHISSIVNQIKEWPSSQFIIEVNDFLNLNPAYNIEKFYKNNENELNRIGIESMHFLYEIARITFQDKFDFKHTPWVLKLNTKDFSTALVVESYAEKANGPFSVSDFSSYIGVSSARASQIIASSDNIINIDKNAYILSKNQF